MLVLEERKIKTLLGYKENEELVNIVRLLMS